MTLNQRIGITIPVLWLGFVLSISFMEAWLKFQAEGVTQIIGLSIGQLVFGVLNKVELFFMVVIIISTLKSYGFGLSKILRNLLLSLLIILITQTFHLLPVLDHRADLIISGEIPASSYFHFYYVFLELIKVAVLVVLSHNLLTKYSKG